MEATQGNVMLRRRTTPDEKVEVSPHAGRFLKQQIAFLIGDCGFNMSFAVCPT